MQLGFDSVVPRHLNFDTLSKDIQPSLALCS